MSKRFNLTVTQDDIDNGQPKDGRLCPFAFALKRMGYSECYVGQRKWSAQLPSHIVSIATDIIVNGSRWNSLSERAQSFIEAFDKGKPVEPGDYLFYINQKEDQNE